MGAKMVSCNTTSGVVDGEDTVMLTVRVGDPVCCVVGEMKGLEGVVVASRAAGRVLLKVAEGMYVELPRICVKKQKNA